MFSLYDSERNSLYPPPLKPLPPIPTNNTTCFLLNEYPPLGLLLSHPVPSPSLRFDVMRLPSEQESCASSMHSDLDQFSYSTSRDSMSSLVDFAQSLLPPTPISIRPLTPSNSVDCRLQGPSNELSPASRSTNQSFYSVSEGGQTSEQIRELCSELEYLKVGRRDSAMFDITTSKPSRMGRVSPNVKLLNVNLQVPDLVDPRRSSNPQRHIADLYYQPVRPSKPLKTPVSSEAETSFMDWDEEEPRFAKVKKSIADLRSVSRTRSNSAPLNSGISPGAITSVIPVSNEESSTSTTTSYTEKIVQYKQKDVACKPPTTPPKIAHRKSLRHRRRTIFMSDYSQRSRLSHYQNHSSPISVPSPSSVQRKRISTVSTTKSVVQRGGFKKFTGWIRKVVNCS